MAMFDETDIVFGEKSSEKNPWEIPWLSWEVTKAPVVAAKLVLGGAILRQNPPLEQEIGKTTLLKHQEYGFNMV